MPTSMERDSEQRMSALPVLTVQSLSLPCKVSNIHHCTKASKSTKFTSFKK